MVNSSPALKGVLDFGGTRMGGGAWQLQASGKADSPLVPSKWTVSQASFLSEVRYFELQEKPLQLLLLLLEHPGQILLREDLQRRLWPDGTYVDFDKGLNTAVKKLRYALGDSPDKPVFIETIPRRGYRFIAPISGNGFLPE